MGVRLDELLLMSVFFFLKGDFDTQYAEKCSALLQLVDTLQRTNNLPRKIRLRVLTYYKSYKTLAVGTPIPWQMLAFAPFANNSLDGFSSDREPDFTFFIILFTFLLHSSQKQGETCLFVSLSLSSSDIIDVWLPPWITLFLVDRVKWQWLSKVLPNPCDYVRHSSSWDWYLRAQRSHIQ